MEELIAARLSRRDLLSGALGAAVVGACAPQATGSIQSISASRADDVRLSAGLRHDVVIRWGEALSADVSDLTSDEIAAGALLRPGAADLARRRFGDNCDGAHFFPVPDTSGRGVLCVNNEFSSETLMFPGWPGQLAQTMGGRRAFVQTHPEAARVSMASVGVSVVEIERTEDGWRPLKNSPLNRRYHGDTPMRLSGPAAGSEWLRRPTSPDGTSVRGTMSNCAAGRTPWGTFLSAEENFNEYFGSFQALVNAASDDVAMRAHTRIPLWPDDSRSVWEAVDARFDTSRHIREPLAFGWIVEIDPLGRRPPVKRTALGRFLHESATCDLSRDGRPVAYSGDDQHFEYLYKFVGSRRFDASNPAANVDLLDDGVLHVARFNDDGTGEWLPLTVSESGPLNPRSGFRDQADVAVMTRAAADVLGATPLDRPEDIALDRRGRVFVACTRNPRRTVKGERAATASSPRSANVWGHILELQEEGEDLGAKRFRWDVFILAGDPRVNLLTTLSRPPVPPEASYYGGYGRAGDISGFGCPDNLALDAAGNLWIVTDGPQPTKANNGCFVAATQGPERGWVRQVMSGPRGAEICGCVFARDDRTLFLTVQHPGQGGDIEEPVSHWPDGADTQPRSSVIAVERGDGGSLSA